MVKIIGRRIEARPEEVFIDTGNGVFVYPKKVDSLITSTQIDPSHYVLVQEGDTATYALSAKQQLGGLNFIQMNVEALRKGLPLASVKNITPYHRNVNLALQGKGVLYDASGSVIEGDRLEQCGNAVNNAFVYLNNSYENGSGFLGLDVVRITGLDAEGKPVMERQPLEECVVDCWADIQEPLNSQGYYTKRAPVQKFEKGRTVYAGTPTVGYVAWLYADSVRAFLYGDWFPQLADSRLGGFLRAEGTAQKLGENK